MQFEELLEEVSASLTNLNVEEVDTGIESALCLMCKHLAVDRCILFQVSEENPERFQFAYFYAKEDSTAGIQRPHLHSSYAGSKDAYAPSSYTHPDFKEAFPWTFRQLQHDQAVVINDIEALPPEAAVDQQRLRVDGIKSQLVLPLRVKGQWQCCLAFSTANNKLATWNNLEVTRLKILATVFSNTLELIRAESTLRESRAQLSMANELLAKARAEMKQLNDRLQAESAYLQTEIRMSPSRGKIIGRSAGIQRVLYQVEQVAPADCAVLVSGETGTGKELIAQEIHRLSQRRDRLMELVNCAALPSALVESELFGRERGAYTGALTTQIGHFEMADRSTIFLDEVGELSMDVQAKLLRVLQHGEFQRLGNPKTHAVDVRVIAATNRDLGEEVRKGRFREDLFYRLKVFPIEIPPLRERVEDIAPLVFAFVEEFSTRMGKKITKVPRHVIERLENHSWPGNIRELRNVIEHSVILSSGDTLKVSKLGDAPTRESRALTLAEAEREHIIKALESSSWRIKGPHGAARRLDLEPSTLYSRMQKLGIPNRRQKDEMSDDRSGKFATKKQDFEMPEAIEEESASEAVPVSIQGNRSAA